MEPINKRCNIISDPDGNKVVVINDLRFKGRRNVDWNEVESCLKEYIGKYAEITESSDIVYIGKDFPDEFVHSNDTMKTKGSNRYAKANSSDIIIEMLEIARNKCYSENYSDKHKEDAKNGWFRYDTKFAIPVYNDYSELERYNIYSARVLVRYADDGNLYLYDILRIKKETSGPL